jgi:hypothetical protein
LRVLTRRSDRGTDGPAPPLPRPRPRRRPRQRRLQPSPGKSPRTEAGASAGTARANAACSPRSAAPPHAPTRRRWRSTAAGESPALAGRRPRAIARVLSSSICAASDRRRRSAS